jgi:hypothetical protein
MLSGSRFGALEDPLVVLIAAIVIEFFLMVNQVLPLVQ